MQPRIRGRAMQIWRRVKPPLQTAEHVHFAELLINAVFDWRPWRLSGASAVVTFLGTAYQGWDPWAVWLAGLVAAACVAVIVVAILAYASVRRNPPKTGKRESAAS